MAVLPPKIHTYHCICTSLLLASTHALSTLPRRAPPSLDNAFILPVPSQAPSFSPSHNPFAESESQLQSHSEDKERDGHDNDRVEEDSASIEKEETHAMPPVGYSLLLAMEKDRKVTIVRREDGFEKRVLWRCLRCRLVVGYEVMGLEGSGVGGGRDGEVDEGEGERRVFEGKVVYLLPNGMLRTDVMAGGKKLGEGDVGLGSGKGVVWE